MSNGKKRTTLRIVLYSVLVIILALGGYALWLTQHYKKLLRDHIPQIVEQSSDSLYHITYTDISINLLKRRATITGLELRPDLEKAVEMRKQHRRIPPTLSTVSIPRVDIFDIEWEHLAGKKSFDSKYAVVSDIKWLLVCAPHPEDSLFTKDKAKKPFLQSINVQQVSFTNPDITYHYEGKKDSFFCFMKGGDALLNQFTYNFDEHIDTSIFLYAHSGMVRANQFIFLKKTGRYTVIKPLLDFETGPSSVTLKNVSLKNMVNADPVTGTKKEIYNLDFPLIDLAGFNWNRLINHSMLAVSKISAGKPLIDIHYIRQNTNTTGSDKLGSYPHQLLLQAGLQIKIDTFTIQKGHFKYVEVVDKGNEGLVEFTDIKGRFNNITNIDSFIAKNQTCTIDLSGKFMHKSPLSATFRLNLSNNKGGFTMDGSLGNLKGDDIIKQVQAFTIVQVTSFNLSHMDMHITGDEAYSHGDFTVLYSDLKISLLKFKSNHRKGKKGPLSFLGSTLLLYPSNPMPDKEIRKVSTSFARDPDKGFVNLIWKNIYRAGKKTAVRNERLLTLTDGEETGPGEKPKKGGFFKRLFKKKH